MPPLRSHQHAEVAAIELFQSTVLFMIALLYSHDHRAKLRLARAFVDDSAMLVLFILLPYIFFCVVVPLMHQLLPVKRFESEWRPVGAHETAASVPDGQADPISRVMIPPAINPPAPVAIPNPVFKVPRSGIVSSQHYRHVMSTTGFEKFTHVSRSDLTLGNDTQELRLPH